MGGKDGIRGYIFQTIVSVIKSLTQIEDWSFVEIEPNTNDDKTDIIWENIDGSQHAIQVKSSINNFGKSEITEWLTDLVKDTPNASSFELILIGPVSVDTNKLIRSINERGIDNPFQDLIFSHNCTIKVELLPFNPDMLDSKIRDELSKLLSRQGFNLQHESITLIADGLTYHFFKFAIKSRKVSKQEMIEDLLSWIRSNYPKELAKTAPTNTIMLQCYDAPKRAMFNSFQLAKVYINKPPLLAPMLGSVNDLLNKARLIKLPARKAKTFVIESPLKSELRSMMDSVDAADIHDSWKISIQSKINQFFNIELPSDFFQVGNLRQKLNTPINFMSAPFTYIGTEEEKNKYNILQSLYFQLGSVDILDRFLDDLMSYYYLPLALINEGDFDEDIKLELIFPSSIQLLIADNFPIPDDFRTLEALLNAKVLTNSLKIKGDEMVDEYDANFYDYSEYDRTMELISDVSLTNAHRINHRTEQLKRDAQMLFDFEKFDMSEQQIKLRFSFQKLNPHEKMALPGYLLIKADKGFQIKYEVKTKNSTTIHTGQLHCSLPDQ